MENKGLVELYIPTIEKKYELFLPVGKRIGDIVFLISKALTDIGGGYYIVTETERLYSRITGKAYDENQILKNTDIRNGSQLILM